MEATVRYTVSISKTIILMSVSILKYLQSRLGNNLSSKYSICQYASSLTFSNLDVSPGLTKCT